MEASKKKKRNKATEEHILEATLDTIKEHTISGTRMHLIAKNADMPQSNVLYYFKTKDELLHAVQKKVLDKCLDKRSELRQDAEDTLEAQLDVFINQKRDFIIDNQKYDYAEVDFWLQGRIFPEIKQGFADSFAGWRNDIRNILKKYVPDLPPKDEEILPYQFVSMLEGATIQYLIDEDNFNLDEYFNYAKKMVLNAVKEYR